MKVAIVTTIRLLAVTILYFCSFAVVSGALLANVSPQPAPNQPSLVLLQVARALLWAAIAWPIVRMMKGKWWEAGLAVALVFAVTSSQLLLPNPLMPYEVRMAHLLETSTSNFLFGWLVVLIFHPQITQILLKQSA